MKRYIIFLSVIFTVLSFGKNEAQDLNPGDGVRITLFNVPESISGDYYIQKDGNVQLPYLGLISTHNRSFEDISSEIHTKYDSLYRDPELTIQPLYKINILGEVKKPGSYYVTGIEKISDLFAMAGGQTNDANLDGTYIVRDDKQLEVDAEKIVENAGTVSDIGLKSGDRIYVPREWWVGFKNTAFIVSGLAAVATIVAILIKK